MYSVTSKVFEFLPSFKLELKVAMSFGSSNYITSSFSSLNWVADNHNERFFLVAAIGTQLQMATTFVINHSNFF